MLVMNKLNKYFFSHARTALKYGLKSLEFNENDRILIPDYNCEVILHPLNELKIKIIYYKINYNFEPDLNDIQTKIKNNIKGM